MVVKRIEPISLAKLAAAFYAALGLIVGVIVALIAMAGLSLGAALEQEGSAMAPAHKGNEFLKGDVAAIKAVITNGRAGADKKYPKFSIAMPKFAFSAATIRSQHSASSHPPPSA